MNQDGRSVFVQRHQHGHSDVTYKDYLEPNKERAHWKQRQYNRSKQ